MNTAVTARWRRVLLGDPCPYCGGSAETIDHVVARARGGRDVWHNLAPACRTCNMRKSGLMLLDRSRGHRPTKHSPASKLSARPLTQLLN